MIPGVTFHPREEWVDPRYPVFGPTVDYADIDTAVIHYTAAPDVPDGDDPAKVAAYLRAINRSYLEGRGYSIGYRTCVDQTGGVWQLRWPEFKSAANKGHNDHTDPILVLVDGADPATDAAARAVRHVIAEGERRAGRKFTITGHGQLSGAATACPGVGLRTQIAAGVFTPTVPPIIPPELEDMKISDYAVYTFDQEPGAYLVGPGGVVHLDAGYRDWCISQGAKPFRSSNAEVLESYKRVARGLNG